MRLFRDFMHQQRYGLLPFRWWHSTSLEPVTFNNTTPIVLAYDNAHGLRTGDSVGVFASPGNARNGIWQVTVTSVTMLLLNGSTAGGSGPGGTRVWLEKAVALWSEDTLPSPLRLDYGGGEGQRSPQYWSWTVNIQEDF